MKANESKKVAILDAGAQYGKVIDRRVRELAVESDLLPLNTSSTILERYGAIIISGGPESVYGENAPEYDPDLFTLKIPVLGICYGMQLMNFVLGGTVLKKSIREDGPSAIEVETGSLLFAGLEKHQQVLMTHGDSIDEVASSFSVNAMSGELIAGIEDSVRKFYGVQFHPEVDLTENGVRILSNFLFKIAHLDASYTMEDRELKAIKYIQEKIGQNYALVLVSGGVDSAVSAALVTKALGQDKVYAIYIDTGFMRQDESSEVKSALEKAGLKLIVVDAQGTFHQAQTEINGQLSSTLNTTTDPETKRKIIGDTFMRVAEQAVQDLQLSEEDVFLVQGTLRPDLIESASTSISKVAEVIKTHHNDTALVRKLRDLGKVIEPLADYHKDEVRELGESLGLPEEIVWRQPFPGPGLAIRLLCATEAYITSDFEKINHELAEFSTNLHRLTLLPVRTVGVQGDGRSYSYLAAISGKADWAVLEKMAQAVPRKIHQVNRVVYVFGDKIEAPVTAITTTFLTTETLAQLRLADRIVNTILFQHNLLRKISQVPVVLFPVSFGVEGNRSIGIRTLITKDFMTGMPALPGKDMPVEVLQEMVNQILNTVPGISRVVYDLTSKPPGTTEWE